MMRALTIFLALLLAACAGEPPARVAPLRAAADNANRIAVAAAGMLRWDSAVESWRDALVAYQSMDDWTGQGRARLGLAHAYMRLGKNELSAKILAGMPEQKLFPVAQRAQAEYQLALLAVSYDATLAQSRLESASRLCEKKCGLTAQLANLAGRLAITRADWREVVIQANSALAGALNLPSERAHAHRLLAAAALAKNVPQQAKVQIEAALLEDSLLADPDGLLDDYRLLDRVAQTLDDKVLSQDVATRQQSLCAALHPAACSEPIRQKP